MCSRREAPLIVSSGSGPASEEGEGERSVALDLALRFRAARSWSSRESVSLVSWISWVSVSCRSDFSRPACWDSEEPLSLSERECEGEREFGFLSLRCRTTSLSLERVP